VYGYYFFETRSTGHNFSPHLNYDVLLVFALGCDIIVIAYGLYPIIFNTEKYFKRRGYENIVVEFEFVKKLLFVGITILVILTIDDQFFTYSHISNYLALHYLPLYDFSFAVWVSSITVVTGALFRITTQIGKKEFRFYLAKAYCTIVLKKEDELDKMKYLFLFLDSYNKYLQRKIKFGIKSTNKIYSDLIHIDTSKKNEIMKSMCECLDGNRLKLAKYLSTFYKVPETEQLFIKESLAQKLTRIGAFLAAAIPIIISIIQLILKT
jgi:hypothetical protein